MVAVASEDIIAKAIELGASVAGIATTDALATSASYQTAEIESNLPKHASVLVLALAHPRGQPELDWWDGDRGTPGNRCLIDINLRLCAWLRDQYQINSGDLPYSVEAGGVFLKDAAVQAGLGVIGRNNLLITPESGPQVRLRAILIDQPLKSSPPQKNFQPCNDCSAPCRESCPQNAFSNGPYLRPACRLQMTADVKNFREAERDGRMMQEIRYCRECEWACPVGD